MNTLLQNKKIGYIFDYQFPLNRSDAGAEQVINTVSSLSLEGLDVELIIPRRWQNILKSSVERKQKIVEYYKLDGKFDLTEILHLPLMPFRLEKYSHALLATPYAKFAGKEILYTRNRMPALMALKLNFKVVFETYRLYEPSFLKTFNRIVRYTQRPNFLGIITHSIPSKESLVKLGVPPEKVRVIYNGFNPEMTHTQLTKAEARQKLSWSATSKIACYTGRLDKIKGIDAILDLAKQTPDIQYYLIGQVEKQSEDWIEKRAKKVGMSNVKRFPWVHTREIADYLKAADVLLIPPTQKPMMQFGRTVLPIKTFTYMASGTPILAPDLPDTQGVLTKQNAMLVQPDNIDAAASAIKKLFEDQNMAIKMGRQAMQDSKQFTWKARAGKIIEFLDSRLSES